MKKLLLTALCFIGFSTQSQAVELFELSEQCENIVMNMIRCEIDSEVPSDEAVQSMRLRANSLNFKEVGYMPLSEQVKANGGKSERMEIFLFCDATIASKMVAENMAFAGYLPCRITLIEENGKGYLITLNMDSTLGDASLSKGLQKYGIEVRNKIYSIISAGAEGDL